MKQNIMDYQATEINDFEQFAVIEREWNSLLSKSYCDIPHLRHEWLAIWWKHFGRSNQMAVILIRKGDELVFAIPLMEVKSGSLPYTVLQSMSNYHSFRYYFLLEKGEEKALEIFFQYLEARPRQWHMLYLGSIPSDIPVNDITFAFARSQDFNIHLVDSFSSPYLSINGMWDEYMLTLKSKFRSNMRNRTKRLNKLGKVEYEMVSYPNELDNILKTAFEIEKKGWKGETGSAIASSPDLISFYINIAKAAMEKGWLRLSFLKLNGQAVSFDYSLAYNRRLYCLKIGYDPDYHQYSVGQLLCAEIMKRCFQDNMEEYDFMGDATTQKTDWTSQARKHIGIMIYNKSLLSTIHFAYRKIRSSMKSVLKN